MRMTSELAAHPVPIGGLTLQGEPTAGPVVVRELSVRHAIGNPSTTVIPAWSAGRVVYSSISPQATPLLSNYGNVRELRNTTRHPLRLQFNRLIDAGQFRLMLGIRHPLPWYAGWGPGVSSTWLIDTEPRMGTFQTSVAPFYQASLAAAGTRVTLVSSTKIPYAFAVEEMQFVFAAGCNNNLRLSLWCEDNDTAPTAGYPGGRNLTGAFGNVPYVVGSANIVRIRPSDDEGALICPERGRWLKLHAYNGDLSHAHDVNAIITIRLLPDY